MRTAKRIFPLVFFALLLGCDSSANLGNSSDGTSSTHPSDSLAGTWDIISSSSTGTFTWNGSHVSIVYSGVTASATLSGDKGTGTWQDHSSSGITIQHSGAINLGVIPFNLGGSWMFTSTKVPDKNCSANVLADAFSNTCTDPQEHFYLGGGAILAAMTAHRTKRADSIFGELGGTWIWEAGVDRCEASFNGGNITATCTSDGEFADTLSVTVTKDFISGSVGSGFEFTARRR
jgi:hypothetical protein